MIARPLTAAMIEALPNWETVACNVHRTRVWSKTNHGRPDANVCLKLTAYKDFSEPIEFVFMTNFFHNVPEHPDHHRESPGSLPSG